MRFPAIAGRSHDDFLVVADVFHFDRAHDEVFRFLDDHVLQRNLVLLDLLSELQVRAGRLPEVHDPLFLRHRTDHALGDVRQKLQTPDRRHVGGFLHDPDLRQLAALIVGEDHLLLVPVFVVRGIQRAVVQFDRALLLRGKVFRSHHQTRSPR